MATVLDAFLVTLGLDNKEFKKGAEEAEKKYEELVKAAKENAKAIVAAAKGKSVEEIAAAKASAKEVEAAGKKAAAKIKANLVKEAKETAEKIKEQTEKGKEFFKGMAESAAEFFGIMMAGAAMVEFVKGTMEAEVAAGRLAKTLNVDVEGLEALQGAVKRVGGTSEGLDASLKGLNSRLEMIAIHGPRSKMALQVFAGLGISAVALKGKDAIGVLGLLSEKMAGMSEAKAQGLGERLGLDEGTIRLLTQGKDGMAALVAHQKALGVATKEQGEQSEKFEQSMLDLKDSSSAVGRELLAVVMPALLAVGHALATVAAWAHEHGTVVKAIIVAVGAAFLFVGASALSMGIQAAIAWVMALSPINLIIGAIALVAGGLYLLVTHFKEVGHWGNQTAYDIAFHLLKAFFTIEHAGAKMWKALLEGAKHALGWISDKVKTIANFVFKVETLGLVKTPLFATAGGGTSAGMAMHPSMSSHSSSTSTRQTHVTIGTINTKATDAQGFAADLPGAIKSHSSLVDQADGGF